eukprot:1224140-Pleurochrysis_carterae.AAC.1
MNKLYSQLQRRLLPVKLLLYGAEPHIKHGVHYRGSRHQVKDSCQSDTSDRVVGDIPNIPPSA